MVIACHTEEEYAELMTALNRSFTVKSLGDISHFLGIQVRRSEEQFSLNQRIYIQTLLKRFGLTEAKSSKIPLDPGHLQQKEESEKLPNNHQYSSLIGGLLYVAVNTRPDIAVSVSILGRSVSNPSQADWMEAKRILRYLKLTQDHELVLGPGQASMEVYVDADWAGDAKTRKSNSGFLVTFGWWTNPLGIPEANMCCVEQHRSGICSARRVLPRGAVDRPVAE
ncbi:uncharacterized protein LOC134288825 [Aedes albopictus]|uniref:Reverse transcriptase Ty1/copia-type domain-containing protein n=1 Tax=Aedes albopictus TaxID=7160 RepID=A0ABM1YZM8_AEDAL